jgi:hypothetical protein
VVQKFFYLTSPPFFNTKTLGPSLFNGTFWPLLQNEEKGRKNARLGGQSIDVYDPIAACGFPPIVDVYVPNSLIGRLFELPEELLSKLNFHGGLSRRKKIAGFHKNALLRLQVGLIADRGEKKYFHSCRKQGLGQARVTRLGHWSPSERLFTLDRPF